MTERYKNGKIYKLVNNVDDEFYVGSTCLPLAKRIYNHKNEARHTPRPVHMHMNDIGWDNVSIVLVEEYECNNKMELERRERYWIETLKPSLNKVVPTRTTKEWCAENRDRLREAKEKWRDNNRDKVNEMNRKSYAKNVEQQRARKAKYVAENKDKERERHAKYYSENIDKIQQKYNENKDAINARRRELYAQKKAQQQTP